MSKVQDCKLTNVGELPFDYYEGGCNTFSFGIMLCFARNAAQECHSLVWKNTHLKILKSFLVLMELISKLKHRRNFLIP